MKSVKSLSVFDPQAAIYFPSGGCLRSFKGKPSWNVCRVTFHDHHHQHIDGNNPDAFYYAVGSNQNIKMITNVLKTIEKRLEVKDKLKFTTFESNTNVLYIETGKWWSDPIRFNLLTAFLKDMMHDDLDEAIKDGYSYLHRTRGAIHHFLEGNIYYNGDFFEGWVTDFENKNNCKYLQKNPCKDKTIDVRYYHSWTIYKVELNGKN